MGALGCENDVAFLTSWLFGALAKLRQRLRLQGIGRNLAGGMILAVNKACAKTRHTPFR
jgi:hypothetical protein